MARTSYITALLAGMPTDQKKALKGAFDYVLDNLRWGRPEHKQRSENGQQYYYEALTAPVAGVEFSIEHGLAAPPYLLVPILALDVPGTEFVPLMVTRAADAERIYLSSAVANAVIRVMVEA
jgi:hypothetical protein